MRASPLQEVLAVARLEFEMAGNHHKALWMLAQKFRLLLCPVSCLLRFTLQPRS